MPQTKWYDLQPSTKLFECALSGMPVIITDTFENRKALQYNTGVICDSNAESFCLAIKEIIEKKSEWDSEKIKQAYNNSTWDKIVQNNFEVLFEHI